MLRGQIPGLDQSGSGDNRLTKWLDPTVNVLFTFSAAIGGGACPPAAVIFTSIGVLFSAYRAVRASQEALFDLFERIEGFFRRLEKYVEVPPTSGMGDVIVDVMAEVLFILGIATREINQNSTRTFLKKLIGRADIEDALRRLDKLTQEEARMATAEGLKATHAIHNKVEDVDHKLSDVNDKVLGVGERVRDLGDKITDGVEKISRQMEIDFCDLNRWSSHNHASLAVQAQCFHREQAATERYRMALSPRSICKLQCCVRCSSQRHGSMVHPRQRLQRLENGWRLLWIHGKPGSGKSILTSKIIQDI
ncbi:hypothetical protein BC826DRAFT_990308, partial [Russula brevipes]